MMTTMRAARFHNHHDIRAETVPTPVPTPSQVLVEVEWRGICGSDLHEYLEGTRLPYTALPRRLNSN